MSSKNFVANGLKAEYNAARYAVNLFGSAKAAKKVADETIKLSLLSNIGDSKSRIIHPASIRHQRLSDEKQVVKEVIEDLILLSARWEDLDDFKVCCMSRVFIELKA